MRPFLANSSKISPRVKTFQASPYMRSQGFRHGTLSMNTPRVMTHSPAITSMKNVPLILMFLMRSSSASKRHVRASGMVWAVPLWNWVSFDRIVGSSSVTAD